MAQLFGDFWEDIPTNHEFLMIGFFPHSIPLNKRWRNNGLSADFIADYLATLFPDYESEEVRRRKQSEVRVAINYIANELIDNAVKFNDESSPYPIRFEIHLLGNKLVMTSTNSVSSQVLANFYLFVHELNASDLEDLYIRRLEIGAQEKSPESKLGILTIMKDYLAKLGWKVETVRGNREVTTLTTMVQLTV